MEPSSATSVQLLVPISVALIEQRSEDGTCNQTSIECISWSLVEASSGRLVKQQSLPVDHQTQLADAIKQVS